MGNAAGIMKFQPGQPCCEPCIIAEYALDSTGHLDNFALSDALHVIYSGGYAAIDNAGETAVGVVLHPQSPYPPQVILEVKGAAGTELRVLFAWGDTDGLIAEMRPGNDCGELRIFRRNETLICGSFAVPGAGVDQWHKISACYNPDDNKIRVWVKPAGLEEATQVECTADLGVAGRKAGFGTGPTHTGTGYFRNYEFRRLWYCGDPPYTSDCEQADEYYGEPPTRIYCDRCYAPYCAWAVGHFDDTDYLSCEWDGTTADWSIDTVGETLDTTVASSILLHKTEFTQSGRPAQWITGQTDVYHDYNQHHQLRITFEAASAGRTILAIVGAADDQNYAAVKIVVGSQDASDYLCGSVTLVDVTAGAETALGDAQIIRGLVASHQYDLRISLSPTGFRAWLFCVDPDSDINLAYWTQQFQARDPHTYHGNFVGLGVGGGSGNVSFGAFFAGCVWEKEECLLEVEDFAYVDASWEQCNWSKISGTWPTREPTDGRIYASSDFKGLLLNPVTDGGDEQHKVWGRVHMFTPVNGSKVGIIFGSDASATNHYLANLERVDPPGRTDMKLYKVNSGVETLLDSVTGQDYPDMEAGVQGAVVAVRDPVTSWVGGSSPWTRPLGKGTQPGAYGPYTGLWMRPNGGEVQASFLKTYRVGVINEHLGCVTQNDGLPNRPCHCPGVGVPCSYCQDNEWPAQVLAELVGLENYNCESDFFNNGYYLSYNNNTCQHSGTYTITRAADLVYDPTYPGWLSGCCYYRWGTSYPYTRVAIGWPENPTISIWLLFEPASAYSILLPGTGYGVWPSQTGIVLRAVVTLAGGHQLNYGKFFPNPFVAQDCMTFSQVELGYIGNYSGLADYGDGNWPAYAYKTCQYDFSSPFGTGRGALVDAGNHRYFANSGSVLRISAA